MSSQAAACEYKRLELVEEYRTAVEAAQAEARERQTANAPRQGQQGFQTKPVVAQTFEQPQNRNTRTASATRAAIAKTNRQYIHDVAQIAKAKPEAVDQIIAGEKTIPEAPARCTAPPWRPPGSRYIPHLPFPPARGSMRVGGQPQRVAADLLAAPRVAVTFGMPPSAGEWFDHLKAYASILASVGMTQEAIARWLSNGGERIPSRSVSRWLKGQEIVARAPFIVTKKGEIRHNSGGVCHNFNGGLPPNPLPRLFVGA